MILIVAIAIFFFGPDKIPELARSLAKQPVNSRELKWLLNRK